VVGFGFAWITAFTALAGPSNISNSDMVTQQIAGVHFFRISHSVLSGSRATLRGFFFITQKVFFRYTEESTPASRIFS
jgi:hypothetical protein